ncbi:hypothetical protein D9M69_527130 [compost metagenome]
MSFRRDFGAHMVRRVPADPAAHCPARRIRHDSWAAARWAILVCGASALMRGAIFLSTKPSKEQTHAIRKNSRRPGRRPHRRDQPVAGGRGAGGAALPERETGLRRAPRRARYCGRGVRGPHAGDQSQPRSGGLYPGLGAGLHARQARPEVLPGNLQGAQGPRDRALLLHRRQRFVGHGAHRQRRGAQGQLPAALDPYPEDH